MVVRLLTKLSYALWGLAALAFAASWAASAQPHGDAVCPGIDPLCGFGPSFDAAFGSLVYGLYAVALALLGAVAYVVGRRSEKGDKT